LELAQLFAKAAAAHHRKGSCPVWTLCKSLARIPASEAPTNDPREFLPFCGACAIGAIASTHPSLLSEALLTLRALSRDPRWRTRESVAIALQALLQAQPTRTLEALRIWIVADDWLAMRAVAAAIAEPAVLTNRSTAEAGLKLHRVIFAHLISAKDRSSPGYKVLRQGVGYSLSVVVQALPEEGFAFMRELADVGNQDVRRILNENLSKARLRKNHPDKVEKLARLLEGQSGTCASVALDRALPLSRLRPGPEPAGRRKALARAQPRCPNGAVQPTLDHEGPQDEA